MQVINPATGRQLREVDEDAPAAVSAKYHRARAAQRDWRNTPYGERVRALRRFRELLDEQSQTLAKTLTAEVGKPIRQARNEIRAFLERIDFFLDNTEARLTEERVFEQPDMREIIEHQPLGVVANISAWNYPYFVGGNVFVPALLTGNTVLYKPSEQSTLTGLEIDRLLHDAGVPEACFLTIVGGREQGEVLVDQPVDGLFFTGSYATGTRIAERVRGRLVHLGFELGGKDPAYAASDVDVHAAASALADGAFYNTGQSCCSVERIYVHQDIWRPFVEAFVAEVKGFVVGDPTSEETYIGPLARGEAQLRHLESQCQDAMARGARLLCGGARLDRPGFYFDPTVLADATHEMQVMKEESFGPIIGLMKVASDDDAIRWMNDTSYGLTASVYSQDEERARKILRELEVGSAYFNCCDRVSPRLPWSGQRHSGLGCTLSLYGIDAFTRPKAWHLRSVERGG
jgi:acyl-CoA reductase-like NAD-dependent aldehyde dehydrogenase